ncbi:MAG: sugar kinase [Hyphomicrobiaceae bacterium]
MPKPAAAVAIRPSGAVISIGECMVELSRGTDGRFALAFGGDTFNTAAYMVRAGVAVAYATAIGDDPYSRGIVAAARAEQVSTDLFTILPGRMPGLYLIETTPEGERSFWYWRDRAAARELFECANASTVADAVASARLVYFSGITLSLYAPKGLDAFAQALARARACGATIAMDSNYRPRGWGGDIERAQSTFARFWALSHIALPTFDDEQALWNDATPNSTADRLSALGVSEIIVKQGAEGALIRSAGHDTLVACPETVKPVDTTAAGDSFNAGYLARRLAGDAPADAAVLAHRLAGVVIQHRGAIVPKAATDVVLK